LLGARKWNTQIEKEKKKTREAYCSGNIRPPSHENGFGAAKTTQFLSQPLDGLTKL